MLNSTLAGPYRLLNPAAGCAGPFNTSASAPSQFDGVSTDNYCLQNRAPYGDFQPAEQRLGASARFTVKLTDASELYTNASYYQNTVIVDAAPSNIQASVPVNTNNIALPPTLADGRPNPNDPFAGTGQYALIQYAFGDIQAVNFLKNHNFRSVTGIKGSAWGWNFDSGLVINHTWLDTDQKGLLNVSALQTAINTGSYNFVNPSLNTNTVRATIAPDLVKTSTTDLDSIDFKATHDIVQLPGGPLQLALGAEARYEAQADPALNPNGTVLGALARPAVLIGLYENENSLATDGVDLDLRGNVNIGDFGRITSDLSFTKIFSFKLINADGTSQQWVGTQAPYILSSGAGTPRYRGTWSNTYECGPASATLTTYYTSGFQSTGVDATGDPTRCLYTTSFCHVASFIDIDLTAIYKVSSQLTASLTVQNLMDRLPPINPADYAGVNYNPTYAQAGIIGRFFRIGAAYKF